MLKIKYVVPRDRPIITIGYKYNTQKVLSFVAIEDPRSIKSGILYLLSSEKS